MESATDLAEETLSDAAIVTGHAARPLGAVLVLIGLIHLLVPGLLLKTAQLGYRFGLGVEFDPQNTATPRVRLVGLGMLAVGGHLLYHGDAACCEEKRGALFEFFGQFVGVNVGVL